jgi:hypothetical protein
MITTGDIEFEPPQRKVYNFSKHAIALVAGDMAAQISICTDALAAIEHCAAAEVRQIAELYATAMANYRQKQAERDVLVPIGLTMETFLQKQRDLAPDVLDTLTSRLWKFNVGAEAIITGIDTTGAHLYVVRNPGEVSCLDAVGFAAIGYGRWHAESQFMFAEYVPGWPLSSALFLLYNAKRRAEVAPSVGTTTDLALITASSGYVSIGETVSQRLKEVYEEAQRAEEAAGETARQQVDEFINALLARPAHPDPIPDTAGQPGGGLAEPSKEPARKAEVDLKTPNNE